MIILTLYVDKIFEYKRSGSMSKRDQNVFEFLKQMEQVFDSC